MVRNFVPAILALLFIGLANGLFFRIKKPQIRIPIPVPDLTLHKPAVVAKAGCHIVNCASSWLRYQRCPLKEATVLSTIRIVKTKFLALCIRANYGVKNGEMWVTRGCGGTFEVCTAAPQKSKYKYLGCYVDKSTRALNGYKQFNIKHLTLEGCAKTCSAKGYLYFGTEIGQECFCGNDYDRYGKAPEKDCSKGCNGNKAQKCGGSWRLSVYATGVKASPVLTSKPEIKVIPDGASFHIACNFGRAKHTDVQYTVSWSFGAKRITRLVSGSASTSLVTALDIKGFKLGQSIFAEVIACFKSDCAHTKSKPWKSNVIVGAFATGLLKSISLSEGETKSFKLQPLFPPGFFCGDYKADCQIKFDWHFAAEKRELKCSGINVYQAVIAQNAGAACGSVVSRFNWHKEVSVSIRGTEDELKDRSQTRILKISALLIKNKIVISKTSVAEVKVTVVDNYHLALCNSINDPHMETFDNRRYNNYLQGDFILYKHKKLPYEVQAYYRTCNRRAACNCAVAARAGDDVIVIDSCGPKMGKKHSPVQIKTYLNGKMTSGFEVRRFDGGKRYHIYFATGTYVIVKVMNSYSFDKGTTFLNVWVKASLADIKNTEGLCGSYDTNASNDLLMRNGKLTHKEKEFSLSWRPTEDEYLYNGYCPKKVTTLVTERETTMFCDCTSGTTSICGINRHIFQCRSKKQTLIQLRKQGEDITERLIASAHRLRCGLEFHDRIKFEFDHHFVHKEFNWPTPSGITEGGAKKICTKAIDASLAGKVCRNIVKAELDRALTTCVMDIKLTDEIRWARSTLSDMKTYCEIEERTNVDLWVKDKDGNMVPNPDVEGKICGNDCNDHGICKDGVCHCQPGYLGEECSIKKGAPPTVIEIKDSSVCDKHCHSCANPVITGVNFEKRLDWWCDISVLNHDGKPSGKRYSVRATILSFEMLTCKLKEAVSVEISVLYRGSPKSRALTYRVYDSTCQNCTEQGCTQRNDVCVINGECYANGVTTSDKTGGVCLADKDNRRWTPIKSAIDKFVATTVKIKNIAKSIVHTGIGSFKAFGLPSIKDTPIGRSVKFNAIKDFLTIEAHKGLACLSNIENCLHGFTLRFSFSIGTLCENMVIFSSCGAKLEHPGVAVYYKNSHLFATVRTLKKQWTVASKFTTIKKMVKLGISWSHTHGLDFSVNGLVAGRANYCAAKIKEGSVQLLNHIRIGGSLDSNTKCSARLTISGFDYFPLFHSLIDVFRVRIVDGGFSKWNDWSDCSQTCGGGTKRRIRTCTNPKPSFGAKDCVGDRIETMKCNTHACKVNGGWSKYSSWTKCSKTCGGGIQSRVRACNNPRPANGGARCTGLAKETRSCNTQACRVNGGWSKYSSWTKCSKTCGGGIQSRVRACNNPRPANGGARCTGLAKETRSCNTQACRVKGSWSKYGCWQACSKTCDGGIQFKERICVRPKNAKGEVYCDGESRKTRACNKQPCEDCRERPVDVVFLIDKSSSIGKFNFVKQKEFIKAFASQFSVGPKNSHFGAVTFSTSARNEFNLNEFVTKASLLARIDQIRFDGGTTHTDAGLQFVRLNSFTKPAGVRDTVEHVVIVLTDGKSNKPVKTQEEAKKMHSEKYRTIAIGIGNGVNKAELSSIATDAKHLFTVKSFDHLKTIEADVKEILCVGRT